jgi:hypothetical protein
VPSKKEEKAKPAEKNEGVHKSFSEMVDDQNTTDSPLFGILTQPMHKD